VDLTGPEAVVSASGNRYLMNVVDDFSSFPWSFPLKLKSDALPTLQAWAKRVEREANVQIGTIRIDGGELDSGAMRSWCDDHGYTLQFSAPYTSAHNGRVERIHLTIMNKMRAMLVQTQIPPNRWDELAMTASYLSARTPSRPIGRSPFEAWHGVKPDLSHLREIGCKAFVLILDRNNPKIYSRSFECILIGYSSDSKAYRLYHRPSHKVVQSFHVKFVERIDEGEVVPAVSLVNSKATPIPPGSSRRQGAVFEEESDDECSPAPVMGAIPIPNSHPVIPHDASVPSTCPAPASPSHISVPATASLIPRRSDRVRVPSSKRAVLEGIPHIPSVVKAVAEAKESASRVLEAHAASRALKAQRASNREERRLTTLELRNSDPSPVPCSSTPVSPSEDTPVLLS
jgi:hypothetical protein